MFQGEGNDKGKTLVQFLKYMNLNPKKIVFIDDRAKNTESVCQALEELGIPHVEFRYGGADKKVQEFHETLINKEYLAKN